MKRESERGKERREGPTPHETLYLNHNFLNPTPGRSKALWAGAVSHSGAAELEITIANRVLRVQG